jgi:hypothetical protein
MPLYSISPHISISSQHADKLSLTRHYTTERARPNRKSLPSFSMGSLKP